MSTLHPDITAAIARALSEDVGTGDVTSTAIIPDYTTMQGRLIAKQTGIMVGFDVAQAVCAQVDQRIGLRPHVAEGARVDPLQVVAEIDGPARSLLTAERTLLNFVGRMSGIATLTDQYVAAVAGTRARILDTRKTAPCLRMCD